MKHKLIIFDWNGTILADTIPALKASNACLEFFGQPPISMTHFRNTFDFPVIHFYTNNGCDEDEILAQKDESNRVFQTTYEELSQNCRTRRGVRETLAYLHARDYHMIVLSNYLTDKITPQLERLGIGQYFQHVCAHNCDGTSIMQSTSKMERVQAYMDAHGFEPRHTTIIGDSLEEPEIARLLGLTGVSITGGVASKPRIKAQEPTHIIHSMREITTIL